MSCRFYSEEELRTKRESSFARRSPEVHLSPKARLYAFDLGRSNASERDHVDADQYHFSNWPS